MTLLEAMVALAILGLSAVGYLGVFQSATRQSEATAAWATAAATADAALQRGLAARDAGRPLPADAAPGATLTSQPWSAHAEDLVAIVRLPGGQVLRVHRLVRVR
jgi:type II secretory pathway pseudopilin PulG